jgi:hypothetical protein
MRVNPEGPAVMLCKWPRSITATSNKMKVTNLNREDAKRQMEASKVAAVVECRMSVFRLLAVPVPRTKGPQIRVGHEPKESGQFGDVQLAVLIPIGHLEFGFEKAQQLSLAYRAVVATVGGLYQVVGHGR